MKRFESKVEKSSSCWVWKGATDKNGYGIFRLDGKNIKAHRFAFELWVHPIPGGLCCCHRCDNPGCVNPSHIFLGTNAENTADKVRKNRQARVRGYFKLSADQALMIREHKGTQREIAERFGISRSQVGNIKRGDHWKAIQ